MRGVSVALFVLSIGANAQQKITVAKDGSGDYQTVQQAFDAITTGNKKPITIFVKKGVYKERLALDSLKDNVTLIGEDKNETVLTFNNHFGTILPSGDTVNTWTSASFFIKGSSFRAENITFENNDGFTAGQAVAVMAIGDRLSFFNCRFVGFQDVLFCSGAGSRQYFKDCYIEGTTDFIFGAATAVFQNCHIHSKKKSHVTAASTPRENKYGFVFFDCKLTADEGLKGVSLGRPWRPYGSVTYIRCDMGDHILAEGWNNWRNPENEKTARYAEYKSAGAGANATTRVKWSKQLSDAEVKAYTLKNIFNDWDPEKK